MPLPAVPAAAAAYWMGPAALAAAKAFAYEYLPAMSSATLGYLLTRLAWRRCVPEWIRNDISFTGSTFSPRKSNKTSNDHDDYHQQGNNNENELERISSVIEKIQALMVSAQANIATSTTAAVPYLYASILAYIQLSAQLSFQFKQQQQQKQETQEQVVQCHHHHSLLYQSAGRSIFEEQEYVYGPTTEITQLQTALEYAIASYYVDDPEHLLKLLNQNNNKDNNTLELLQHSINTRPGSVGHFMAISKSTKTLYIGCKGTSSLEDVFTDSCGRSVSYDPYSDNHDNRHHRANNALSLFETESYSRVEVSRQHHQVVCTNSQAEKVATTTSSEAVDDDDDDGTTEEIEIEVICQDHDEIHIVNHGQDDIEEHIRCHEGILIAAKRLLTKVHDKILELVVHGDYNLVLTGHSLGAGAVCLLAILLKSRYPSLVSSGSESNQQQQQDCETATTTMTTTRKMQVYAFASPPVLSHDAAIAARSYMTCVVHHADLIPRSSLANVAVLLEFLRTVSQRLVELDKAPATVKSTAAFLRMLSQGSLGEPILTLDQVEVAMQAARDKIELRHIDHLYVPGRVLLIYDNDNNETSTDTTMTTTTAATSSSTTTVEKKTDNVEAKNNSNTNMATETTAATSKDEKSDANNCNSSNNNKEEREDETAVSRMPYIVCNDDDDMVTDTTKDEKTVIMDAITALEDAATAMMLTGPFCVVTEGTTPALRSFQVDGFRMLGDHTSGSYMAAINSLAQKEQTVRQLYMQHQTQQEQLLQLEQQEGEEEEETTSATTLPPSPSLEDSRNEISDNTDSTEMQRQDNDVTCASSMAPSMIATPLVTTSTAAMNRETANPALPLCGSV